MGTGQQPWTLAPSRSRAVKGCDKEINKHTGPVTATGPHGNLWGQPGHHHPCGSHRDRPPVSPQAQRFVWAVPCWDRTTSPARPHTALVTACPVPPPRCLSPARPGGTGVCPGSSRSLRPSTGHRGEVTPSPDSHSGRTQRRGSARGITSPVQAAPGKELTAVAVAVADVTAGQARGRLRGRIGVSA